MLPDRARSSLDLDTDHGLSLSQTNSVSFLISSVSGLVKSGKLEVNFCK